ncbi:P2X purinoceptor 4, partial [Brachionus plicatilis]
MESTKYKAKCSIDDDCKNLGSALNSWNGIPTGKCVQKYPGSDLKVCEIFAWCPVEDENIRTEDFLVRNVLNFTIFIKNDVEFKKFGKKIRNIQPYHTNKYLQTCEYHKEKDPYCPIFQLNYILSLAENDPKEIYLMLIKGGVILIEIIWDCDFDFQSSCLPKYFFHRFDSKQTDTATGFNFRFANRFREHGTEVRELYKAYGLRLIINVSGIAGKFNIVPLMLTIGAGIGLMSISVILADCVLLNFTKKKRFYQEIKELDVDSMLNTNLKV